MDEDTDMAYGRVQGTYQGTVTFEEKRDIERKRKILKNMILIIPLSQDLLILEDWKD